MEIGGLLVLALAGVGGVALVEAVVRRSDLGAGLVLGLLLFDTAFAHVNASIFVGSIRIGTSDILFVVMMAAAVARLLRIRHVNTPQGLLLTLLLLVAWSVARGAGSFGIPGAVNEARGALSFMSIALYFSTVEPRRELLSRIGRLWLLAAVALSALAVVRWGALVAGVGQGVLASATGNVRVLTSGATFVIAVGAFLALPLLADVQRSLTRFLGPAMLVIVVLLQHRSVWVVAAVGTVYLFYRQRTLAKYALAAAVGAVAVLAVLVSTVFYDEEGTATEQLAESAQSTGTWEWRVAGWSALLRDAGPESAEEYLLGRPFGSGFERQLGGRTVDVSPHNQYVSVFLRMGVIGLAATLFLYAFALRGTHLAARRGYLKDSLLEPDVIHVATVAQLVYFIPYGSSTEHGLLLGLAVAVASQAMLDRSTAPRALEVPR